MIKLAALGDVVRTACLLPTLRRMAPACRITWVTSPAGARILSGHDQIDQLVVFDAAGILRLTQQRFDLVLSLDKEPEPAALCNAIQCDDKRGMMLSEFGTVMPIGQESDVYFSLGLDDHLKFVANRQSYPELIHRALGLEYRREPYRLPCADEMLERASAKMLAWRNQACGPLVGLNTGSGSVFANKSLSPSQWLQVGKMLLDRGHQPILLGGPQEAQINEWICEQSHSRIIHAGCDYSEAMFVAIVSGCDSVITGDTLALHIAIARNVPVVALFGPTCAQEIDMFDRGEKLVAACECSPCYKRSCTLQPSCMDRLEAESIVSSAIRITPKTIGGVDVASMAGRTSTRVKA
jgi:heptosyltransferase-2